MIQANSEYRPMKDYAFEANDFDAITSVQQLKSLELPPGVNIDVIRDQDGNVNRIVIRSVE